MTPYKNKPVEDTNFIVRPAISKKTKVSTNFFLTVYFLRQIVCKYFILLTTVSLASNRYRIYYDASLRFEIYYRKSICTLCYKKSTLSHYKISIKVKCFLNILKICIIYTTIKNLDKTIFR